MVEMNIMLVDDDEAIRTVFTEVLTEDGYRVTALPSAEEALEAFRERAYEVVITDLRLPGWEAWSSWRR